MLYIAILSTSASWQMFILSLMLQLIWNCTLEQNISNRKKRLKIQFEADWELFGLVFSILAFKWAFRIYLSGLKLETVTNL